jgi:hypothetical protein
MEESKGRKSKYQAKKQKMNNGTYNGTSPFFSNIPDYQYDRPLETYPHIREMIKNKQLHAGFPKRIYRARHETDD